MTDPEVDRILGRIEDLFVAGDFWRDMGDRIKDAARPHFLRTFKRGIREGLDVQEGAREFRIAAGTFNLDEDLFPDVAQEVIAEYLDLWWEALEDATRGELRRAISNARANGWTPDQVAARIEGVFGAARAATIAVTETTRLLGLGAQESYKREGFQRWSWRTTEDGAVCSICGALNGQTFPIDSPFAPGHPNCRCWPVPVGEVSPR